MSAPHKQYGADLVTAARRKAGQEGQLLSRREMARILDVTEQTIYRWEKRKRAVPPKKQQRIRDLFGVG